MITFRLVLWRELWRESAASACVIGWNVQEQFNETCINTSPNFIEKWKRRASDCHNFPLAILWKILRRTQFQSRLREVWKSERVVLICLCLRGFVSLCVRAVSVVSVRLCCLRDCYLQCKSWSAMYGSWKHAQERLILLWYRSTRYWCEENMRITDFQQKAYWWWTQREQTSKRSWTRGGTQDIWRSHESFVYLCDSIEVLVFE